MNFFDISYSSETLVQSYLKRLQLKKEVPGLEYLNSLIARHQEFIPFENFSRICDFRERPLKFSTLQESLEGIEKGLGGVCWSHARSFRWLLKELGFKTEYLYMEPGHVCVKVELDQEYYADVGYGAPFFTAKPLRTSFIEKTHSEEFAYEVGQDRVVVTRTPGPTKTLLLNPFTATQIEDEFMKGNIWGQNRFLSQTVILRYEKQKLIRLYGNSFLDFRSGKKEESELNDKEVEEVLRDLFRIDPQLFFKARNYLKS